MRQKVVARRQPPSRDEAPGSDSPLNYESALLECASGSQSAVGRIYAQERRALQSVAHGIVHDRTRAEDVIHEAFAQILRDAKSFDPTRGAARSWIYAIVRNTALKMQRDDRREFAIDDECLAAMCERSQASADPSARMPDGVVLRRLLEELEPRRRASLILAFIDGRTHEEIGRCLGVPVGTVKAWIRRELIAIRRRLG